MAYEGFVQNISDILSSVFGIPSHWLIWPQVLILLILPIVCYMAVWASVLVYKLRIFKNTTVNALLGIIIVLVSLPVVTPLIIAMTPAMFLGMVVVLLVLMTGRMTLWRIIAAVIAGLLVFIVYGWLITLFQII